MEEQAKALEAKEQQLVLLEQQLKLKEEDLRKRERKVDSTNQIFDSLGTYNHLIIGSWTVTMNCVETDCPGSAIGDTKTEQWDIAYEGSDVIAKAFANKKLVRVYKGKLRGHILTLAVEQEAPSDASMSASLNLINVDRLEGQREIMQSSGCRIIYSLKAVKIVP